MKLDLKCFDFYAMSAFRGAFRGAGRSAVLGLCAAASLGAAPAWAADQCILAGRRNAEQRWAPQARGVELLDVAGSRVAAASNEALARVKSVRLSQPALLSDCNGNQSLPAGGEGGKKAAAPALAAGQAPIPVQGVYFPPMKVGGELVELKVAVPEGRKMSLLR